MEENEANMTLDMMPTGQTKYLYSLKYRKLHKEVTGDNNYVIFYIIIVILITLNSIQLFTYSYIYCSFQCHS